MQNVTAHMQRPHIQQIPHDCSFAPPSVLSTTFSSPAASGFWLAGAASADESASTSSFGATAPPCFPASSVVGAAGTAVTGATGGLSFVSTGALPLLSLTLLSSSG